MVGQSHTVARATEKVAVSLERRLFERVERLRKSSGESRSALVGRALRQLLRDEGQTRAAEQYVQAYQRVPETHADEERARVLARRSLVALPWDEE
jgi:metal-responsive CopG/Arc/MetJ family transcriptional regulator